MPEHDVIYKNGIWRLSLADQKLFDTNRLMISSIEKLKRDIENLSPEDKKAKELISELLYHYCWKIKEE